MEMTSNYLRLMTEMLTLTLYIFYASFIVGSKAVRIGLTPFPDWR